MLTAHGGHARVCAVRTQSTGFRRPGTEAPLPSIRPANHCPATSQPKASLSLKSPPVVRCRPSAQTSRGPTEQRRGRARAAASGQSCKPAASPLPPVHTPPRLTAQTRSVVTAAASGAQTQAPGSLVRGQERDPHRTGCVRAPDIRFTGSSRASSRLTEAGLSQLVCVSFIPRLIPFEPKKQADGCFREGQGHGRQQRRATSSPPNFLPYYAVMRPSSGSGPHWSPGASAEAGRSGT